MTMEMEGEEADTGSWELDGESLIMDKGEEKELTLTYDGETLYTEMDGMEMIFSRDPEAAAGFVPAEIRRDAAIEDFAGKWTGTQVSALGMTAPLEMIEMEKAEVEIKDNLITFTMAGGFLFGEWEISTSYMQKHTPDIFIRKSGINKKYGRGRSFLRPVLY